MSRATIRQREADLQLARDQRRALAQPVCPAAAPEADARRHRSALPGGRRAARSGARAEQPVDRAARRAAHQPGQHRHRLAGQRLRRAPRRRPGRVRRPERTGRRRRRHRPRPARRQHRRKGPESASDRRRTRVEVDAFPGEVFTGRIARVAPVLDPATRTAPIEIEIPNPGFRLKPGMYARVTVTTDERKDALVVPSNAVVDYTAAGAACSLPPATTRSRSGRCARHRREQPDRDPRRRGRGRPRRDDRRRGASRRRPRPVSTGGEA